MHSLPRHQEEIVNNMLREYKLNFTEMNGDMIGEHGSIELGIADDYLEIELHDITPEVKKKREKFNRAKEKRNFNKRVEEELEEWERT